MSIRPPRWTERECSLLKQEYEAGTSIQEIAKKLNRSESAVRTRTPLLRIRRNLNVRVTQPIRKIAEKLGVHPAGVCGATPWVRALEELIQVAVISQDSLAHVSKTGNSNLTKIIARLAEQKLAVVDNYHSPRLIMLRNFWQPCDPACRVLINELVTEGKLPAKAQFFDKLVSAYCNRLSTDQRRLAITQLEAKFNDASNGDSGALSFLREFFDRQQGASIDP